MYTYGRVKPSGVIFTLEMTRSQIGPIDTPFALVENDAAKKTKESRLSMMDQD